MVFTATLCLTGCETGVAFTLDVWTEVVFTLDVCTEVAFTVDVWTEVVLTFGA